MKRELVTSIEYISADGRAISPLIIRAASTHCSNWTTPSHPRMALCLLGKWTHQSGDQSVLDSTCLRSRHQNSSQRPTSRAHQRWLRNTRIRRDPQVLFREQHHFVCRLPSHTSHKLQPCDLTVFSSLKGAYRAQAENLYRGGANTAAGHATKLSRRGTSSPLGARRACTHSIRTGCPMTSSHHN